MFIPKQVILTLAQFTYMEPKMKIIQKEFNIQTGQEIFSEREETAQEKERREAIAEEIAKAEADAKVKAEAKIALLERLGITEEEARLLLG